MVQTARDERFALIRKLVTSRRIRSHKQLQDLLASNGLTVSQATLSRDLRRIGLVKRSEPDGSTYYALPTDPDAGSARTLHRLLPDLLLRVRPAGQLLVLRTLTGSAQSVAAALDHENWPDIVGTVAGDDTVLIILESSRTASAVAVRLEQLAGL
jgi:transcriptional regulator of arginine metabolism